MPVLSVIVPVYNSEKYLCRCIDSILGQTLKDLELLLINDGSKDGSGALCDRYAKEDTRVKVLHQTNKGAAGARNAGIELARGEYVGFVDSDDYIEPDMYKTMYNEALKNGAEIVLCDAVKEMADGKTFQCSQPLRAGFYDKEQMYKEYFPCLLMREDIEFPPTISNCLCILKRAILEEHSLCYDEDIKYCEDSIFGSLAAYYADSFFYLKNQYFYHYCFNVTSTTNTLHLDKWDVFKRIIYSSHLFFGAVKDYDFTRQLSVQTVYFAFNAINEIKASDLTQKEKRTLIQEILCSIELKTAWKHFKMPRMISGKLKIKILFLKYKIVSFY